MYKFVVALCLALIACLATVAPVQGAVTGLTNAERLRRNLPPAPPVRRTPTRVVGRWGKPSSVPSKVPTPKTTGRIQVRAQVNGSTIGYVENSATDGPTGINFNSTDLKVVVSGSTIEATNAAFAAPLFIGANETSTIAPDSPSTVPFTNVASGANATIWSFDKSTGSLTPQLTNADGSEPKTLVAFDLGSNSLFFTGNVTPPAIEVSLFIVA
ncbi:hypothetical protein DENSPDRAFT_836044 [Dentipellis sp. KUC8613]|nr:hypothetical protein DENSPDRAFT_836044 [Dentipellis sp. KUC8613]